MYLSFRRWPLVLLAMTGAVGSIVSPLLVLPCLRNGPMTAIYVLVPVTALVGALLFILPWWGPGQNARPVRSPWFARLCRATAIVQMTVATVFHSFLSLFPKSRIEDSLILLTISAVPGAILFVCSYLVATTRRNWIAALRRELARQSRHLADGATFDVDVFGWFPSEALEVVFDDTPRETHSTIDDVIESTWKEKLRLAEAGKRTLYNGLQGRLIKSEVLVKKDDAAQHTSRVNGLRLVLGTTCYRDFVGTNLYNAHLAETYGLSCLANPLGTSAVIITADGYLLYGRRSDRVGFHAGYLHTFGGSLEAADQTADGSFDVFSAIRRELREELHLADGEITELVCTGLVRDHQIMQPELLFDASVSVTRDELLARFNAETDPEHDAIEVCYDEPNSIISFIERAGKIAPVAVASIMLHGRFHWGRDWYDQTAFVLFGELPPETSV